MNVQATAQPGNDVREFCQKLVMEADDATSSEILAQIYRAHKNRRMYELLEYLRELNDGAMVKCQ